MNLGKEVRDVRQVFTRHVQQVRQIVVAHRQDDRPRVAHALDPEPAARRHDEHAVVALALGLHRQDLLVHRDLQLEDVGDLPVVAQRLGAGRLVVGGGQRHPADLHQFRRGEEHHVDREPGDGVHEGALFEHLVVEAVVAAGDGGGQSGRAAAHDEHVARRHDLRSYRTARGGRARRPARGHNWPFGEEEPAVRRLAAPRFHRRPRRRPHGSSSMNPVRAAAVVAGFALAATLQAQTPQTPAPAPAPAAPPSAQAPATPPEQPPVFRTGVEVLPIDVTVLDRDGRQVVDLALEEFQVEVDGRPRKVVSAEYVKLLDPMLAGQRRAVRDNRAPVVPVDTGISSNGATGEPPGRAILLLVDQGNIRFGSARPLMQNALKFVDRMQPNDRLALVSVPAPGELVDFTTDHAKIREAMLRVTGRYTAPARRFNISLTEAYAIYRQSDSLLISQVITRECAGVLGAADLERCERDVEQEASEIVGDQRQQTDRSVAAMRAVLKSLGALEGPKSVILVSEGLVLEGLGGEVDDLATVAADVRGVARRAAARRAELRRDAGAAADHRPRGPAAVRGRARDADRHGPGHAVSGGRRRRVRVPAHRAGVVGPLPPRRRAGPQRPGRAPPPHRGQDHAARRLAPVAAGVPHPRRPRRRHADRGTVAHAAGADAGDRPADAHVDVDLQGAGHRQGPPAHRRRDRPRRHRVAGLRDRAGGGHQGRQGDRRQRRAA